MATCPDCGIELVRDPCGFIANCGRRVSANDPMNFDTDWKVRMFLQSRCVKATTEMKPRVAVEGVARDTTSKILPLNQSS